MSNLEPCIYCDSVFDTARGQGDHVIPVQLGSFRKDVRFRKICPRCNNRIGASEQQLLRCGPEALFRAVIQPGMPKSRKRRTSWAKSVFGAAGPEFTVQRDDHYELVEASTSNPQQATLVDHIVLHDETGQEFFIRLFPGMQASHLKAQVHATGIKKIHKMWFHCADSYMPEFEQLIAATWPNAKREDLPPTEPGLSSAPARIKVTVNEHYWRALTKIGFHFYLSHSRRGFRGDEPTFAPLRRFIMEGGNKEQFFRKGDLTFMTPFSKVAGGGVISPDRWCHILATDESFDAIVVCLQLFAGPGTLPSVHYLTLGRTGSTIFCPSFVWGYAYLYDAPQVDGPYAGQVEEMQVTAPPGVRIR